MSPFWLADFNPQARPAEEKSPSEQIAEFIREAEDLLSSGTLTDLGSAGKPPRGPALGALGLGTKAKTSPLLSTPDPKPATPGQEPPEKLQIAEVSPEKGNSLLFEELARRNMGSYESRCLFVLLTGGEFSCTRVAEVSGLRRQHVARALKSLEKRRIVVKTGDELNLNRSPSEWDVPVEVLPAEEVKPEEVSGDPQEVQGEKT
jgi:hypothetical protein